MANNCPHKGHRNRVRERILAEGLDSFQPHEILEFLLFHTIPQKDTNVIAHKLINTFGSLQGVLDASAEELMNKGNLSENSAIFLSSLTQVFSFYEKSKKESVPLNTPEKIMRFLKPFFIGQTNEKLVAVFLDSALKVKATESIGLGMENGLNFNTKEILRKAISFNAHSVAVAHNHPKSSAMPSKSDINSTSSLKNQLEMFDIKLIDHIIFGSDSFFSFADDSQLECFVSGGKK